MAFQAPNAGQGRQNRKILEELEEQKKRLRIQAASQPSGAASGAGIQPSIQPSQMLTMDSNTLAAQQRVALQHAHQNSVGFFITQDSSFGNLILPVLPR
ncbi:SOSS complex subunit C [Lingula anatina]|uniref:SOSS complex subunit C n=1 Tax=Lingula anatina TaxID=7574 RepID=A0A1S3ITB9_LINAN|nr:SOSS complex subunit C [Lingula anatina]|eukprot:XP_013401447.1 SOSS complex subunit C [Lingula anatina]